MTLALRNLSALSFAQGFTHWHYRAPDLALASVTAQGFFNGAAGHMQPGDMIAVSASDGGAMLFVASAGRDFVRAEVMCATSAWREGRVTA